MKNYRLYLNDGTCIVFKSRNAAKLYMVRKGLQEQPLLLVEPGYENTLFSVDGEVFNTESEALSFLGIAGYGTAVMSLILVAICYAALFSLYFLNRLF